VTVSVLSGRVKVLARPPVVPAFGEGRTKILHDGEAVTYSAGRLSEMQRANLASIRAWHARRVRLVNQRLDEAIEEFNRYTTVPLALGDPSLASLRISGSFRAGETQALLRTLEQAFGLRSEQRAHTIVLLKPEAGEQSLP
jgi:transmembrane sensor